MAANYVEIKIKASDEALPDLAALRAQLDDLKHKVATAEVNVDDKDATARLLGLNAQLARLDTRIASPRITLAGAAAVEAQIASIDASLAKLGGDKANVTVGGLNNLLAAAATGTGRFGALSAKVSLFGGALGHLPIVGAIGGLHLLAQGVIETAGTLIPAGFAFAAFGAAAIPTVVSIAKQMLNLHTVSTATGQAIYPLTGGITRLTDSVKPQVYQLFGDALEIAGRKGSGLTGFLKQAGFAVDHLASRFTVAVTSGKGFGKFLSGATSDLSGWGNLLGNVGGILGNVLKQVPGYAQVLLSFAGGITHVAETITGSAVGQKIIGAGLAFHGAAVYIGLAATGIAFAASRGLLAIGNLASNVGSAGGRLASFGSAGARAAAGLRSFGLAAGGASQLPWGWIAIAAAAVGFLAYKLITAKDATQQWVAGLQSMVQAASVVHGMTALMSAQAQVASHLTAAQQQLGRAVAGTMDIGTNAAREFGSMTGQLTQARQKVADLTAGQKQLQDQTALFSYRIGRLGTAFGGTTQAIGLLTAAGVKMSDMLDPSKWAAIVQQVRAVALAYAAMGQKAGVLGSDMNAMTLAGSDQVTSMTKLNQAWDTTIGIVSGGQGTFITFEQSLGAVTKAAAKTGASMKDMNAPSLQLRGAWQSSYADGAKLIDALRMMSAVSPGGFPSITRAVRDTVAQLIPFGKQSVATRAELVAMAQEVNPGIRNFRELTTWLGRTRGAGKDLNKILGQAGLNLQDVARDAQKLSDAMQSNVTQAFSLARMRINGTNQALSDLSGALAKGASASVVAHDKLVLFNVLVEKDGYSARAAAMLVNSLGGAILKVPAGHRTVFQLQGLPAAMQGVRDFQALLAQIPANKTTTLTTISVGGGRYLHQMAGGIAGAASGGVRSGLTMVGEHGPELAELRPGSRVWNSNQVQAMMPGSSGGEFRSVLELRSSGLPADEFLLQILRHAIRVRGGNVQVVLGR